MTKMMTVVRMAFAAAVCVLVAGEQSSIAARRQQAAPSPSAVEEELWDAARAGDTARVARALERGADVNAKTRYGATALTFAADKGHLAVVTLLLDRGADINAQDTFYKMRALDAAMMNDHTPVALLLLERGSQGAGGALMAGLQNKNATLVKAALASKHMTHADLKSALALAKRLNDTASAASIEAKLAALPAPAAEPAVAVDRAVLQTYAGTYRNESMELTVTVELKEGQLVATTGGNQPPLTLVATSPNTFKAVERADLTVAFAGRGGTTERMIVTLPNNTFALERMTVPAAATSAATPAKPPAAAPATPALPRVVARTAPRPWPSFRGANAAGSADGQGAAADWDVASGRNIRWKAEIPGIANSSPIVWGNRVFVTTAISSSGDKTFRTGLYGDVKPVEDLSEHTWKLFAIDKDTGKVVWERTAFTGVPKVKRHTKASQANSTPATDGRRIVALFGSIGLLAAWDVSGKELWRKDVGVLDSGWFFDPVYQWGHSSSPIIYKNTVILQADRQKDSFVAAYHLDTGKEVWRTTRDEISTWGTPTILSANGRDELVTNGTKVRGYDPATGKLLWTLGPNSEVTVGTPVVGEGVVYVTGGYPPVRPIYAVRSGRSGDISLAKGQTTSEAIAWSNDREGTYIPSPIVYEGILYTLGNNGVLSAYDAKTGERIYRSRVGNGGSFSASPVAADGRLYIANEDGEIFLVRTGRTFEQLGKMEMKEVIMATPAISDGLLIIRTLGHVYGIGEKGN